MGISREVAEVIVREHAFKPLHGKVVLLGHQTMFFSPAEAIELMTQCGVTPTETDPARLELDNSTRQSKEGGYIKDTEFFRLLGVNDVVALDHSDYEGAELIWNLNLPIPDNLANVADFILDGSTIDNVFDPACTLRNMARMLKPGGRLISTALGSNHYAPYMVPTPQWLFDFFVYNRFADARLYYLVYAATGLNVLMLDHELQQRSTKWTETLHCPYTVGIVTVAEKAKHSTFDENPSQHHYRPDAEWDGFEKNVAHVRASKRPIHITSRVAKDPSIPDVVGFKYLWPRN